MHHLQAHGPDNFDLHNMFNNNRAKGKFVSGTIEMLDCLFERTGERRFTKYRNSAFNTLN